MCDLGLFNLNTASDGNPDVNINEQFLRSQYYSPHKFNSPKKSQSNCITDTSFSILHNNMRSLKRKDSLKEQTKYYMWSSV